jgi:hypothetical protein
MDRLRYILAIDLCYDVRESYLRSQDVVMDRQQALDARNMDSSVTDFHDFIVQQRFNDDSEWVVPYTCANGSLLYSPLFVQNVNNTLCQEKSLNSFF